MKDTLPRFKNGDTVIFNAAKWDKYYGGSGTDSYHVLVTDYDPENSETFTGTYLDGNNKCDDDTDFFSSYFEKVDGDSK